MRREAGWGLIQLAKSLHAAEIEPMSEEEVVAEVRAVRAARRERAKQMRQTRRS